MRFFTHENKERKKENTAFNTTNGDDISTRFEEAPRALLLFLETPFYFLRLYTTKRLYATSTKRNKRSVFSPRSVQPRGTSYRTKRALTGLESGSRERGSNPLLHPGTRVKRRDFRFRSSLS